MIVCALIIDGKPITKGVENDDDWEKDSEDARNCGEIFAYSLNSV